MLKFFIEKTFLSILLFLIVIAGCNRTNPSHWSELIPDSAPFLLIPEENTVFIDFMEAPYIPLLDDLTPSALQLVNSINEAAGSQLRVEAFLFYTDTANDWQPVWISPTVPGLIDYLSSNYQKEFAQNRYQFKNHAIERLFISDRTIYVVELGKYTLFSESSLGIEQSIRTNSNQIEAMPLTEAQIEPGSFIVNTSSLDTWVQQLSQVTYRPSLIGTFEGGLPISMKFNDHETDNESGLEWKLSGILQLEEQHSTLLRGLRADPRPFTLDRFIPINSAAFSIIRIEPRAVPHSELVPETDLDNFFDENPDEWSKIAETLDSELAFASFAESGAASASEYLYIRELKDESRFRNYLNELASRELVVQEGNTYRVSSLWLGKMVGSEINPMENFYINIYRNVAIIAQRRGLAQSVGGDVSRRRVMFYDDDYMMARNQEPEELSSITYMNARPFSTYIQPWLSPQNYFSTLVSPLDLLVISTIARSQDTIEVSVSSFQREIEDQPYREQWIFPLAGSDITGIPVTADISGSGRDELIFATENGTVYVLASDGTAVTQTNTGSDRPIGPPVVYDWYGNNQNVIMQAAGNKIYAWNSNGSILPNFPMILNEQITTPLTVSDITRNGIAEVIVATGDRNLHILNARGQAISGWPQTTNSVITGAPLLDELNEQRAIFAITENTLHSWQINGERREGFPVFMDTELYGRPAILNNHLLAAGQDGSLYSVGLQPLFADTLSSTFRDDSLNIQNLSVASERLNSTPSVHDVMLRDENGDLVREDHILLQSGNGSVFLYNSEGKLRFTSTMGQPGSNTFNPTILDIDRNQRQNIVSLADFGRLYAWDLISGNRVYDLPTTGLKFPLIKDLTGDGNNEIIGQTRDGIRAWTIIRTRIDED